MGGRQSVKPGSPLHTQYVSAIIYLRCYFNSVNINNRHDTVYGAVIMTKVIASIQSSLLLVSRRGLTGRHLASHDDHIISN